MSFGALFFLSVVGGLVGSLSGMGGGVVLIPVLTFLGTGIKQAIAISNLSTVAVSCGAASVYVQRHMPNLRVGAYLEVFAIVGAFLGALLTLVLKHQPLFFLCGSTLCILGLLLWTRQKKEWKPISDQDPYSQRLGWEGSYYDDAEGRTLTYRGHQALVAGSLMGGAGVVSGLLGIGGSGLTVLIHNVVIGLPPKVSLTMSNLIIGVMALAGSNVYLEAGLIDPHLVAPVILGVPLGAWVGSKLLNHLPNRLARAIFLVVLISLGLEMILHGLWRAG